MTKEEVLQKANEYCSEKGYTSETLTDEFKDKFSDFFSKKYPMETSIDADGVFDDIKFNLNTAFSATSKGITSKAKAFETKENEYKRRIAELNEKNGVTPNAGNATGTTTTQAVELSDAIKAQLAELERFKDEARKSQKFKEVLALAKKGVRQDLHKSLENYAEDFVVTLDATSEEQAKKLTSRFQDIFRDSIGDIKPLAPKQTQRRDEEFLEQLPKIKI